MAGGKGVKNKQKVKTARKAAPKAAKSKKAAKAPRKMPNGVKNKQKVKTARKATPKAAKSKKAAKAPRKMPNAGQKKKTVKTGKNTSKVCKAPKTPKPKTATSPGRKITGAKQTAVPNHGVGPSSKPIKKETIKVQASGANPGTSQNTGQATKKRAPKRKLDQPKKVCKTPKTPKPKTATTPGKKIMGAKPTAVTNLVVGPSSKPIKKETIKVQASGANPGTSQNTGQATKKRAPKRKLDQPKQATPSNKKIRINMPMPATPSIKNIKINMPKPERPRLEDKRPILVNVVQPVQPNQPAFHNTVPVQQNVYHYHQKQEEFQIQEGTRDRVMSGPGWKANNHFVDKHRKDLIGRVPLVDPILDSLMAEKVLSDEQYDNIRSKPTTQEKMRELYKHISGIGDTAKDKFYDALEKHNPLLIQDLKAA